MTAERPKKKNISQTLRLKLKNYDAIPFVPLIINHMTEEYVGTPEIRLKHSTTICRASIDEDLCVVMLS